MKLSRKSRYALQALLFLAENTMEGPQPLGRIAQEKLPGDFLEQLLGQLRREGLVQSVRGKQGGYLLAKPAKDISLHQIVHAMEGPTTLAHCVNTQGSCEHVDTCRLHRVFHSVTDEIDALMARVSLQDIINNSGLVPDDGGTA